MLTKSRALFFVAAAMWCSCKTTNPLPSSGDAAADVSGAAGSGGNAGSGGYAGSAAPVDGGAGTGGNGGGQAGAGVAGGGGQTDAGAPPTTVILERGGALGFCVGRGQLTRAEAAPDATGGVVVSGAIHRGWQDPCPSTPSCELTDPLGPARLSAEQQARLGALVAALPAGECAGPSGGGCDPCLISTVTVDGVRYVDNPCSAELCPGYFKTMYAIESFFDGLVPECSHALPLKCGDRLTHSTTANGRANLWLGYNATARAESGRETVYAFDAAAACKVKATLKNLTTDLDLLLLTGCDPSRNTFSSSTPIDLQTVETVSWTNMAGRTDYLVVDGYAGAEGSYTLEVDCTCP